MKSAEKAVGREFPIGKSDIHYNPQTQEVTLRREKFDGLVSFVRELVADLERLHDQRDIARYQARRAQAAASIFECLVHDVEAGSLAIANWVSTHSIKQLSERTGIPYATCHRIITERLKASTIEVGDLAKLLHATEESAQQVSTRKQKEEEARKSSAESSLQSRLKEGVRGPFELYDKVLKCVDCGTEFVSTAGEQIFFRDKGFPNEHEPNRCRSCKAKRATMLHDGLDAKSKKDEREDRMREHQKREKRAGGKTA